MEWTAELVEEAFVDAFRKARSPGDIPVYSSTAFIFVPCGRVAPDRAQPYEVLSWAERFVPDRKRRRALLIWARAKVCRDYAVAEFCREQDIARSTFEGWWRRAVQEIVNGLEQAKDGD